MIRRTKILVKLVLCLNIIILLTIVFLPGSFIIFGSRESLQPPEYNPPKINGVQETGLDPEINVIKIIPNPIVPPEIHPVFQSELNELMDLINTMPSSVPEQQAVIVRLKIAGYRDREIYFFHDEPIKVDEQPIPQLSGWRLKEVYRDFAIFTNGDVRAELKISGVEQSSNATPLTEADSNFDPKRFNSKRVQDKEDYQLWEIDQREIEWVLKNQEKILNEDVSVSPYKDGGIRVEKIKEGSIAQYHGLQTGDVVKSINNSPVDSFSDAKEVFEGLSKSNPDEVKIEIDRYGRKITFHFKKQ